MAQSGGLKLKLPLGQVVLRFIAAVAFTLAGANHFINPGFYQRIVPPMFPSPAMLVAVSGVFEIAGGIGLLIARLRRAAGWGLIALLLAVFPANIYMALYPDQFESLGYSPMVYWLRLPLQVVFILWVWYAGDLRRPTFAKSVSTSVLVFCVLLPFLGCNKFQALDATIPSWGYTRTTNLTYGTLARQKLDVYRPRGPIPPAGVVVFFYGGYWREGSKEEYRFAAQAMTSRGFVAVLSDYRLYPEATFPAFVQDGALAVRWVHDHIAEFGGDPARIYLMGHSAGAHIVALLTLDEHYMKEVGLDRSVIRATAALSGPYDFLPGETERGVFNMPQGAEYPAPETQPITFADGSSPPILLIHGQRDQTVSPQNAVNLATKLRAAGGDVQLIEYANAEHVKVLLGLAFPFRWIAPTLRDSTNFFRNR